MHATEMKTKRHYTAPVTQRAAVELEGGFCGSIMINQTNAVKSEGHTVGEDYNFDGGTSGGEGDAAFSITWE